MTKPELEQLIAAWLDGRISQTGSQQLQKELLESKDARNTFRSFAKLDDTLRTIAARSEEEIEQMVSLPIERSPATSSGSAFGSRFFIQLAVAATALIMVGWIAYQLGQTGASAKKVAPTNSEKTEGQLEPSEKMISGHATMRRVVGVQWSESGKAYREGDVVPAGVLEFNAGVAEIDLFCGATLVVEGPAKLDLESDWSVRMLSGRLRANVPPAARGFVVKAADSEIIDLGTEFALEVGDENVRVQVVDGEVKLKGGAHDGKHLVTGEAETLVGKSDASHQFKNLSTIGDVQERLKSAQKRRFENWKQQSLKLRKDERLIAYYPIAEQTDERIVANRAATGNELDGRIVGLVERPSGRFGAESVGLAFDRAGSRVRTRIDGDFEAFTFTCWVRIDGLDHRYNALFMGDGYENGEPHWQIRWDGKLMFSVMIDDTPGSGFGNPDARFHRIYYTDSVWDSSMSGQWLHIAAVYDPAKRIVTQYVNGEQMSHEAIQDKFFTDKLRVGPAEIGNWGQPLRDTPDFAVRNLNGVIDELSIFKAALTGEEIKAQFENGKPAGY